MKQLQIIEHKGERVITTAQLAEEYECTEKKLVDNFNNNKSRYVEGKHYVLLQGDELREFRSKNEIFGFAQNLNKLYLWTERGTLFHAKSLNTDKAWEVYENLVEFYFSKKEATRNQYKASLTEHPGEVANLIKVVSKLMEKQGSEPCRITENAELICGQYGIALSKDFVKVPQYEQFCLSLYGQPTA